MRSFKANYQSTTAGKGLDFYSGKHPTDSGKEVLRLCVPLSFSFLIMTGYFSQKWSKILKWSVGIKPFLKVVLSLRWTHEL